MTQATREALQRIEQILHEAGWDQAPASAGASPAPVDLPRIRHAFETLIRPAHFEILQAVLEKGLTVEQAGARIGLAPEEASRMFQEALHRLDDFVHSAGCSKVSAG